MPHGRNIYAKAYYMTNAAMCAYTQSDHALPQCKYVMRCCDKFPCVNLPGQEKYDYYTDTSPSIRFHIYHITARCTTHGRLPLNDNFLLV